MTRFLLGAALVLAATPAMAQLSATTTNAAKVNVADQALFDIDGNGTVTRNEFNSRFAVFDTDKNGVLSATERTNAVASVSPASGVNGSTNTNMDARIERQPNYVGSERSAKGAAAANGGLGLSVGSVGIGANVDARSEARSSSHRSGIGLGVGGGLGLNP